MSDGREEREEQKKRLEEEKKQDLENWREQQRAETWVDEWEPERVDS
jgi:hypothetical protein